MFGGIQQAAAEALLGPQDCVHELVGMYERRRDLFIRHLREIGWEVEAPQGSFFCWFPVPEGHDSESFSDLLIEKANVVVAPGIGFGKQGDRYVRVGLLTPEERLKEAAYRIGRLGDFLKGLKKRAVSPGRPLFSVGIKPFFASSNPIRLLCEEPVGNGMSQHVSNIVRKSKYFFLP